MSIKDKVTRIVCAVGVTALSLSPVVLTSAAISMISADAAEANNGKGGGGGRDNDRGGRDNDRGGRDNNRSNRAQGQGNASASRPAQTASQPSRAVVEETQTDAAPRNHGAIASELKGLNAAHANPNAFANASPNSQVGRIAAYQTAALATIEAGTAVQTATDVLADAQGALGAQIDAYEGRTSGDIQADIDLLDPAAVDYQDRLASLNGELDAALTQEAIISGLIDDVVSAELALEDAKLVADAAQATEDEAFLVASDGATLSDAAMAYFRDLLELPAIPDEVAEAAN